MNAIENMLRNIRLAIPKEILEIGFLTRDDVTNRYTSLDEKIIDRVINRIVKNDLNLLGGVYTKVFLRDCEIATLPTRHPGPTEYIIRVPKELTGNRSIIEVLKLTAAIWNREDTSYLGNWNSNTASQLSARMLGNVDQTSVIQTSRLELIGENTIVCKDPGYPLLATLLHVSIENQSNLENVNRHTYLFLSDLAVLAAKMYIWSNKVVALNMGEIYGGHELSLVKDLIDEYKDARNEYLEKLQLWSVYSFANSKEKMDGYIKMLVGNNI